MQRNPNPFQPAPPQQESAPPTAPVMPGVPALPTPVIYDGQKMADGGLLQEGGSVDPVSGNEVPTGSLKEEVRDDIPAQLSEGEFVFPADVVRFIGLERLMQLRQAAKEGLSKMEAMGQMGNSDEATMDDTGEFETEIDDIMKEVEMESEGEEEEEPQEMQVGGMPEAAEQKPMQQQMKQALPTKGNKLKPQEIIRRDLERDGLTAEEQKLMRHLAAAVRLKKAIMIQTNNTVFVGLRGSEGQFKVHLYSQDSPNVLADSIKQGVEYLKKANIKQIQSVTDKYEIISLLQTLGYAPQVEKIGNKFSFTMEIK
jgi:hypothetical protein